MRQISFKRVGIGELPILGIGFWTNSFFFSLLNGFTSKKISQFLPFGKTFFWQIGKTFGKTLSNYVHFSFMSSVCSNAGFTLFFNACRVMRKILNFRFTTNYAQIQI